MNTAAWTKSSLGLSAGRRLWQRFQGKIFEHRRNNRCAAKGCDYPRDVWLRIHSRRHQVRFHGIPYCANDCLERALLARAETVPTQVLPRESHRVPLGLLLLARRHLTDAQLRSALDAQRVARSGRIGEWLQQMGFANEGQITAALACQWSCPVLQPKTETVTPVLLPEIPLALLNAFRMVPVSFVAATATLHMAFADRIDYSVLYAIEQMLECRTQPCLVSSGMLESGLEAARYHSANDIIFERVSGASEWARIICNYAVRITAQNLRLTSCRPYSWVRMDSASGQNVNLVLRLPLRANALSQR